MQPGSVQNGDASGSRGGRLEPGATQSGLKPCLADIPDHYRYESGKLAIFLRRFSVGIVLYCSSFSKSLCETLLPQATCADLRKRNSGDCTSSLQQS